MARRSRLPGLWVSEPGRGGERQQPKLYEGMMKPSLLGKDVI